MTSAEITTDEQGRRILVKRATDTVGRALLEHEGATLQQARHPGVVELLDLTSEGEEVRLELAWVPGRTLDLVGTLPVDQAAGLAAEIARSVADLHRLRLVHGRLTPDHVIVPGDGHAVICGWSGATTLSSVVGDPMGGAASLREAQADDVAALGSLLRGLVGPTELEPIPDRRRRRRRAEADCRAALLTLADVASHEELHRRPTAAALVTDILSVAPNASLPRWPDPPAEAAGPEPTDAGSSSGAAADEEWWASLEGARPDAPDDHAAPDPVLAPDPTANRTPTLNRRHLGALAVARPTEGPRWGRHRQLAVGAAVTVVAALALVWLAPGTGPRAAAPPRSSTRAVHRTVRASTTTAAAASTTAATTTTAARHCPLPQGPDVDGDGCPDPITIDRGAISTPQHRYVVGVPGDQLVVADWNCDGRATPALLRHDTGEVYVFPDWASPARSISVPAIATVDPKSAITADDPDHDGCADLVVHEPGRPARHLPRTGSR